LFLKSLTLVGLNVELDCSLTLALFVSAQVRKGHSKIYQQDIIDVLDKQLLEGLGVLLTEEEQQKCKESVCTFFL